MQNTSTITAAPKQSLGQAWAVCMVAALFFFYIFIQMTKFNAIGGPLMADFKINSSGLGALSSMYFWGNVIFLFPAGLILDRCSAKKTMLLMMAVSIICTVLFSFTSTMGQASWCFLITGIAGAFALMTPLRLASHWFPSEKMALASGLIITIGFTGAMVSQSPLTMLTNAVGWRHAIWWDAAIGVVIMLVMMAVVKDYPVGKAPAKADLPSAAWSSLWLSIKHAIANRQNWLFGLYTCLINVPVFVFGAVFGAHYLVQSHQLTDNQAGIANVFLFLGAMAGSPAFGWISDKMQLRRIPMYIGGLLTIGTLFVIMYASIGYVSACVLLFILGFVTSAQVITYPVIAESNVPENIAAGFGMGSTLIMSGGAIFVPLFGWLLDLHWDGKMVDSVPWHTFANYVFALWMLPIISVIAIIAIMLGKETRCKRIA